MSAERGKIHGLIEKPGSRLMKDIPLKFVGGGHGAKKSTYAELNLTSMVDMLTILVVFLLQTFSASGELAVPKDIVLPEASNWKDIEQAEMIAISKSVVTLGGRPVANAEELNRENTVDWKITDLHDQLVTLKNNYKLLHPSEDFPGTVIIQADKGVDFKVMKKVLYTCAVAGYRNVNFAVNEKAKSGGGG